jgi:hypothetical protein
MCADEERLGMAGLSLLIGLKWFVQPSNHGGIADVKAFAPSLFLFIWDLVQLEGLYLIILPFKVGLVRKPLRHHVPF